MSQAGYIVLDIHDVTFSKLCDNAAMLLIIDFLAGHMPLTILWVWWGGIVFIPYLWLTHGDVIKWKHFPRYWPFVRGIHRSPGNKGQWRGALMFSLIYTWINSWVNKREAGDLRRHCAHYDAIVMLYLSRATHCNVCILNKETSALCIYIITMFVFVYSEVIVFTSCLESFHIS